MRTNNYLLAGFILAGIIYMSCRKLDQVQRSNTAKDEVSKFFRHSPLADRNVQAVFDFVKSQNEKYHFVSGLVSRIGYPKWNYSLAYPYKDQSLASRNHPVGDSAVVVYVPFARDNQQFINSALIIRILGTDTAYRFLMDWQYKNLGFDTTKSGWNGWDVFHLFTKFDYLVFGHREFRILDSSLFKGDSVTAKILPDSAVAGRLEPQVECTFYQLVTCNLPQARGNVVMPSCYTSYQSYCTTTWVYFPDGTGGGGGDGWTPPDPCDGKGMARQPELPEGCGGNNTGGWTPVGLDEPQAPEPIDSLLARYSRALKDTAVFIYDNLSQPGNIEHAITLVEENGRYLPKYLRTNNDSSFVIPHVMIGREVLRATWHSHVSRNPDSTARDTFSPDDIDLLRNVRCLTQNFVSFADCRDKRYALVINDVTKAQRFFNANNVDSIDLKYTTMGSGNTQQVDERCVKNVIGVDTLNGISFYVSTDRPNFQTWTLLNPH
jgi:hypothetical protein